MRVFVTGATGFIGSAIVKELIDAGHHVLGLSRSDKGATALTAAGAEVLRGSLQDLESLKRGVVATEGVIHAGFIHDDFTNMAPAIAADEAAIQAMGAALAGSNRPLIVTAGTVGLPTGRPATEDDVPSEHMPRKSESAGLAFAKQGVRAMCVRLPPTVHGDGDHGFVPALIGTARAKGSSFYVGEGKNSWSAVHRLDAARLYRLALEKGTAGARWHGVGEQGVPTKQIAEVIGRRLNVPVVSKTPEEAAALLGFIGTVFGMDATTSSARTQEELGWNPTHAGLLEDLEKGNYFAGT